MKWFQLAQLLAPILGLAIPGAAPLIPLIILGVNEAEQIPGADGQAKKAHVLNLVSAGAATATATGEVAIDAADAAQIANAVFDAVDGVHAIVQDNQTAPTVVVPPAA